MAAISNISNSSSFSVYRDRFSIRRRLSAEVLFSSGAASDSCHLEELPHPQLHAVSFYSQCKPHWFHPGNIRFILKVRCRVRSRRCVDLVWLSRLSSRFIGTGIQYCFTRNLHSFVINFYFSYFMRVITGALACVFICLSVNHFGRRGMLLLSAIITGLSSLLLLALTQCTLHNIIPLK